MADSNGEVATTAFPWSEGIPALDENTDGFNEVRGQDALAPEISGSLRERGQITFGRTTLVPGVIALLAFTPVNPDWC